MVFAVAPGSEGKGSPKKRPITDPEHVQALLSAARRLSNEHWEVVTILYRTGIEVHALSKITWRDYVQGWLVWKRPKRRETLRIPVDDDEMVRAVRGYIARPRKSADQIDRLVRDAKNATGLAELANVSPMTLRLTRCWLLIREGRSPESVARQLALAPAIVRGVAEIEPPAKDSFDENGMEGPGEPSPQPD